MPETRQSGILTTLVVALIAVIVLLIPGVPTQVQEVKSLLVNGGFEKGWHLATLFWTPEGGPFDWQYQEITPPAGWTAWWRESFLCSGTNDWRTGRPEVRVIPIIPDPGRVHSGYKAAQWFTFWHCHSGGLLQQVRVQKGHYYTFSIYAHSWFSNCDFKSHYGLPLDYDCDTENPILWAQDYLSVGVDPTGGIDPMGPNVTWGERREIYGVYGEALETGRVQAQAETLTVFVRSEASHPLKHCDFYLDDATLLDVIYQIFLPVMRR